MQRSIAYLENRYRWREIWLNERERQQGNGWRGGGSNQEEIGNERTKAIRQKQTWAYWKCQGTHTRTHTHTPTHTQTDGDAAYVSSRASWRHLVPKLHRSNQVTCSLRRGQECVWMCVCARRLKWSLCLVQSIQIIGMNNNAQNRHCQRKMEVNMTQTKQQCFVVSLPILNTSLLVIKHGQSQQGESQVK